MTCACRGRDRWVCLLDATMHRLGFTLRRVCDGHDRRMTGGET